MLKPMPVHPLVIAQILPALDLLPPVLVLYVPPYGKIHGILEGIGEVPSQLIPELGRIDGITFIIACTATDVSYF